MFKKYWILESLLVKCKQITPCCCIYNYIHFLWSVSYTVVEIIIRYTARNCLYFCIVCNQVLIMLPVTETELIDFIYN